MSSIKKQIYYIHPTIMVIVLLIWMALIMNIITNIEIEINSSTENVATQTERGKDEENKHLLEEENKKTKPLINS